MFEKKTLKMHRFADWTRQSGGGDTGRARLIRTHSSARISLKWVEFELVKNLN